MILSRSKYGNRKTVFDGITFDSIAEAKRYADLKLLERAGVISDLLLQPKFPLVINGMKVCTYIGDFSFLENGNRVVEDVKGVQTPVFRLKAKLVKAVYGIEITVRAA